MNINHVVCVCSNWFAEIKTGTIMVSAGQWDCRLRISKKNEINCPALINTYVNICCFSNVWADIMEYVPQKTNRDHKHWLPDET